MRRKIVLVAKTILSALVVAVAAWAGTAEVAAFLGIPPGLALSVTWVLFAASFACCISAQLEVSPTKVGRLLAVASVVLPIVMATVHAAYVFYPLYAGEGEVGIFAVMALFELVSALIIVAKLRVGAPYLCTLSLVALPLAAYVLASAVSLVVAILLLPFLVRFLWVCARYQ